MTIHMSILARNAMLDGLSEFVDFGVPGAHHVVVYQTNLELCDFVLGTDPPFLAAANAAAALNNLQLVNTGTAVAGNANRLVLFNANEDEAFSATVSAIGGGGDVEVASLQVTAAASQYLNSFTLLMGPTGVFTIRASFALA